MLFCCRILEGTDVQKETFLWERTGKEMDRTVSGVVRKYVSLRGAAGLSKIQYSTLKDRENITVSHDA